MNRKPYTQYSRDFKVEAIRLVEAGDETATQVARELRIRVNQLGKWELHLGREVLSGAPAPAREACGRRNVAATPLQTSPLPNLNLFSSHVPVVQRYLV